MERFDDHNLQAKALDVGQRVLLISNFNPCVEAV